MSSVLTWITSTDPMHTSGMSLSIVYRIGSNSTSKGDIMKSFKVGVRVLGEEHHLSYNALRFATAEEAESYAKDLFSRWTMMVGYEIEPSDDPVNYRWTDQGLQAVESRQK